MTALAETLDMANSRQQRFLRRYPSLWHLAHGTAWEGIQRHGLRSAQSLVIDLFDVPPSRAQQLLTQRRDESVLLQDGGGRAVLRDQKPIRMAALPECLVDGTTPAQWIELLNSQVFLFPKPPEESAMFATYSHEPQLILQLNTASLFRRHAASVRLTRINTGYFMRRPAMRGPRTFQPITTFDAPLSQVKEVTVRGGIPDVMDHLESVTLQDGHGDPHLLWPSQRGRHACAP